jgi:tRNA/rRNA methyltransferase
MAGTDSSIKLELKPAPVVVLCEPQLGENIGTAARAMANFGLWELRLVKPRDGWPSDKAIAAAAKAEHVISRVQVYDSVEEAIADLTLVLATTARKRDMFKPVIGPDEAAERMVSHVEGGEKCGLLFGRERWGLNNDEVVLSDAIVTLPVEPAFASLNIAQAVLVLAYEWRRASEGKALPFSQGAGIPAEKQDLMGLFEHLESSLDAAGFFTVAEKRPSMVHNIRTMIGRANFNAQEVRTFRGIISSLERRHARERPGGDKNSPKPGE